jgi:hypothetical protein
MDVLFPFDKIARRNYLNESSNQKFLIYDQNIFSFETRLLIKQLFLTHVEALKNYQKFEESFYINKNFSIKEVFESISIDKKKYLVLEDVHKD